MTRIPRRITVDVGQRQHGLTLVELVVAITISSIVVGSIAMIMSTPVDRYVEQARRNELVESGDRVMRLLGDDLAQALPNSVRIGNFANTDVLQMLEVDDVAYYEDEVTPGDAGLSFTSGGDTFTAYGLFSRTPAFLVVNNQGEPGRDAYELANVISQRAVPVGTWGSHPITLAPTFSYTNDPPQATNRLFAVPGPITYICDRVNGSLRRFVGHSIAAGVPASESDPQLDTAAQTVAAGITACRFTCNKKPGTSTCTTVATAAMTLSRGTAPENDDIQLLSQFPVENVP